MFIVLYRWRIKSGAEEQFVSAWSGVTKFYLEKFDSLGSRLHRGSDGLWYGYAQWESEEQRDAAFKAREDLLDEPLVLAREDMAEAIQESLSEVRFEVVADYLKPGAGA